MIAGFDPASPDFAGNPWPGYQALRARDDLPFWDDFGGYLVARYDDIRQIALDRRMVRGTQAFASADQRRAMQRAANFHDMPFHERFVQTSMLEIDGPDHDRLRKAVFPFFTKTRLEGLRGWVSDHVTAQLDRALAAGRIDFIADLAADLPAQVIGRLIGTPPDMARIMVGWSEDVVSYFDVDRTPAKKARAEEATRLFHDLLQDLCRARRAEPQDDLTTALLQVRAEGRLTEDELIATLMQLLHAGHGSTVDAMGNAMNALLDHPDQMALLRGDPTLMPGAVQESFRYAAPLPFFHRYAAEDLTILGRDWPQGTKFGLLYASANRDSAAFANPDRFDITRRPNVHLAFGQGAHVCLGNNLARLNMEILFGQLLTRTRQIGRCDPVRWKPGLQAHGPVTLPVTLIPA